MQTIKKSVRKIALLLLLIVSAVSIGVACNYQDLPYTVTLETFGGTQYEQIKANAEDVIVLPVPEKENSEFLGWYDNAEYQGEALERQYTVTGDATVYAKWQAQTYTVTFESNCETQYSAVEVTGAVVALPTPEKVDYVFEGWYDNAEYQGEAYFDRYVPTGDVTLYAKWVFGLGVISFESNGGTTVESIYIDGEQHALEQPFKYGYRFVGWYDNAQFDGAPVESLDQITQTTTLYALWSKITYVYMYYGQLTDNYRFEYEVGDVITVEELYELFTPDDMTVNDVWGGAHSVPFTYWAYEGDTEANAPEVKDSIVIGEENVILVAQYDYSTVPANAHLTYNEQTGEYTTTGKVAHVFIDEATPYGVFTMTINFAKGSSGGVGPAFRMKMPNMNYQYESNCWYLSTDICPNDDGCLQVCKVNGGWGGQMTGSVVRTRPAGFAKYFDEANDGERLTVTMTIVAKEGDFEVYYSNYGGEQTEKELAYRYSDHYKDGGLFLTEYTGTGWGLRSSTNGAKISNVTFDPAYNVVFSSKYEQEKQAYCYSNELGNHTSKDSGVLFENAADKNTAYYDKFIGWATTEGGEVIDTVSASGTLYAVYEKVELHTATFDGKNDGEAQYLYFKNGEALILPEAAPEKNGFANEDGSLVGFKFVKWQMSGQDIAEGLTVTGDVVFEAVYEQFNAFRVKFVTNMDGVTVEDMIVPENTAFTLPVPEKEGFRLVGWFDEQLKNEYVSAPITANMTLYGVWVERITVTFTAEGGQVDQIVIDKGGVVENMPAAPDKANQIKENGNLLRYAFSAWKTEEGEEVTDKTAISKSVTLIAHYDVTETRNGVVVTYDENGGVIYSSDVKRLGSTGASLEGWDFVGQESDWSKSDAYELSFKLTLNSYKGSSGYEFRTMFFTDPAGYLTAGTEGRLEVDGTGSQKVLYSSLFLSTGAVTFGSKITGTSKHTWEMRPSATYKNPIAECEYTKYYNSLKEGDKVELYFKVVHGITDGKAWVKYYIQNSLLFVYGLEADAGSSASEPTVHGERLYGMICTEANAGNDNPKQHSYMKGELGEIGGAVGIWEWFDPQTFKGWSFSEIKNVPTHKVVTNEKGKTATNYYTSIDQIVGKDGETYVEDDKRYYDKFVGWSLSENGALAEEITGDCTLYAVYEKTEVTVPEYNVTFTVDGSEYAKETVFDGETLENLPEASKPQVVKENGNVVSYTFLGWYDGEQEITAETLFTKDTVAEAKFDVVEKRRNSTVTYDENGKEIYTWYGTGNSGFAFPDEYEAESAEISYTLKAKAKNGAVEVRNMFFVDMGNQTVNMDGTSDQSNTFFAIYLNTGYTVLGGKFYGNSKNNYGLALASLKDCDFKSYYTSLNKGDLAVLNIRIQYGVVGGNAWIKCYINDDLLYTYGLTEEQLNGEPVYGRICNDSNQTASGAHFAQYMHAGDASKIPGYKTGVNIWENTAAIGGVEVSNVSIKPMYLVTANVNGVAKTVVAEADLSNLVAEDGEDFEEDGTFYYNKFIGWSLTENGELVTSISSATTLYAVYSKTEAALREYEVTFISEGNVVGSETVLNGASLAQLPEDLTKDAETKANGNIVTYTFLGWYVGEEKLTLSTTFGSDTVVEARFEAVETRNGMTVTYDEQGNVTYTHNDVTTGTIDDSVVTDWTKAKEYEVIHTLTYANWQKQSGNYRLSFFTKANGMTFNGVAGEYTVWFNLQPSSGTIIFGTKINNSSVNNYETGFGAISADCPYKIGYNSLELGKSATFSFKLRLALVEAGTNAEGETLYNATIKIYVSVNSSEYALLYTFGFDADADDQTKVGGETVWGKICTDTNFNKDNTKMLAYLKGQTLDNFGVNFGLWAWQKTSVNGGATIKTTVQAIA